MSGLGVTIAVPRGALLHETLDRLEAIGLDTGEVRCNDRKLLFADIGVVTMRPSDVPTYVEAGAADIGITGKDVLVEQRERRQPVPEGALLGEQGRGAHGAARVPLGGAGCRTAEPGSHPRGAAHVGRITSGALCN